MVILPKEAYITIYIEKWIKMTAYQQAGQWNNNMNINTDRHLQKRLKAADPTWKAERNQYRLVHWMALPESLLRVARNQ